MVSKLIIFSFEKIDFDLMQYQSKSTSYPKNPRVKQLPSSKMFKLLFTR